MSRQHPFLPLVAGLCTLLGSVLLSAQSLTVTPPSAMTAFPGQTIQVPISVACNGITDPVSVVLKGLPSGITAAPLTLPGCGTGNLAVTLSPQAAAELWPTFQTPLNFIDSETATVQAVAVSGATRATASFPLTISINNSTFAPATGSIDLPVIRITTPGPITEARISGSLTVTSAGGTTAILPGTASSDGTASFSIHGNSTALVPKLSYNVKLNTSSDLLAALGVNCGYVTSSNAPTCDKSKSYVLLASFFDKSLLRHSIAMDLARSIPSGAPFLTAPANTPTPTNNSTIQTWAPHTLPVDVYLNGAYQGVYILIEDVKIDTHRINIKSMGVADISGTALTGGYLLDADYRTAQTDPSALISNVGFLIHLVIPVVVEDPGPPGPEQKMYMQNDLSAAQTALFASNFTDPNTGWRSYFDSTAMVNYFLVNELMENYDSGRMVTSTYMFKDRNNGLIYMGPVWDFDVSSGNAAGSTTGIVGADATDPTNHYMQNGAWWYWQLFKDPGFVQSVQQQWQALQSSGRLESWFGRIGTAAGALNSAAARDNQRWPKLGLPYFSSGTTFSTYPQEVAYLQGWLRIRAAVMDQQFGPARPATTVTVTAPTAASAEQPATVVAQVAPADATGTVYFMQNGAIIGSAAVANGQAQIAATLVAGNGTVRAVYTGSTTYMPSYSNLAALSVAPSRSITTLVLQAPIPDATGATTVVAHVVGNSTSSVPTGSVTVTAGGVTSTGNLNASGDATLTLTSAQHCAQTIAAQYSGNASFMPASATQTFPATQPQTITLTSNAATVVLNQPFQINAAATQCGTASTLTQTLTPTATSAGLTLPASVPVTNGVGSFSATATAAGTYTVSLGAGVNGITAIGFTVQAVAPTTPAITWASTPTLYTSTAPFAVSATSNSSATITYSLSSGPATLSGNTLTLTGSTGTVIVQASQPAQGTYAAGQATLTLQVLPLVSPALTFRPAAPHTYGDAPFPVAATTQSTAAVTYSLVSGPATLSGSTLQLTGAGNVIVQASQAANAQYAAATTQQTIAVAPAQLTITAADATRSYGTANPVFSKTVVGLVGTDSVNATVSTTATATSAPGTYSITPALSGVAPANYICTIQPGTLTITQAKLSIAAPNASRVYGAANPTFPKTVVSALAGDVLVATFSTTATASSAPGTYDITATASGSAAANYIINARPGTLTITQAAVTMRSTSNVPAPANGQPVQYTVTAAPQVSGVPSGSVGLLVDGALYATANLVNGQAVIPAQFASGQHTVAATYSGDANFAKVSASTATSFNVADADFTLTSTSSTVHYSSSGMATPLQLVPQFGTFSGPVTLTVTGDVPDNYTLGFSPALLPEGSAASTVQLTMGAPGHASLRGERGGLVLAALMLPTFALRRRRIALAVVLCSAALATLTGCGVSNTTPAPATASTSTTTSTPTSTATPTPHIITVTAQCMGVSHQVTLTLISDI